MRVNGVEVVESKYLFIIAAAIAAISWAGWITYQIHEAREDIDAISNQVGILRETVGDQDLSDQLDKMQKTLDSINRRLP